ncbi:uncharacterized protein [Argopecten irradians]|uniref:uncharacterized protein n=1 Tax=Argopecten irradians TaxID=31199 RepID=UPI00371DA028
MTKIVPKILEDPFGNLTIENVLEDIVLGSSPYQVTNPHPYKPISMPRGCGFHGNQTKILIMMYSGPGNINQRRHVRQTWRELKDPNVRLVFLLGLLEDAQYVLEDESDQYGDIVQEDFCESHGNKSTKMVMGYNWAVTHCPAADVILILDETLHVVSDIVFEYIRDLVTESPTRLFRNDIRPDQHTGNSYVNLISFDVAKQFHILFPYIKPKDENLNDYVRTVANILSIKHIYDPYLDHENPASFFAFTGQNVSKHLLTYPLNINFRRLVGRKVLYNEDIPHQPINENLPPNIHRPTRCKLLRKGAVQDQFLVVVWSDAFDSEQRSTIREAWGYPNITVKIVFVVGFLDNHQNKIDAESTTYGDILQVSAKTNKFHDTLKTVATFTWIAQNCENTKFVLFLDGNINVNTSMTMTLMKELVKSNDRKVFLGQVNNELEPDRNAKSLTYVSENDYPFDRVPPRMLGLNYILSFDLIKTFDISFPFVKYCSAVDIYIGIVASKLMLTLRNDERFDRTSHSSFLRGIP